MLTSPVSTVVSTVIASFPAPPSTVTVVPVRLPCSSTVSSAPLPAMVMPCAAFTVPVRVMLSAWPAPLSWSVVPASTVPSIRSVPPTASSSEAAAESTTSCIVVFDFTSAPCSTTMSSAELMVTEPVVELTVMPFLTVTTS